MRVALPCSRSSTHEPGQSTPAERRFLRRASSSAVGTKKERRTKKPPLPCADWLPPRIGEALAPPLCSRRLQLSDCHSLAPWRGRSSPVCLHTGFPPTDGNPVMAGTGETGPARSIGCRSRPLRPGTRSLSSNSRRCRSAGSCRSPSSPRWRSPAFVPGEGYSIPCALGPGGVLPRPDSGPLTEAKPRWLRSYRCRESQPLADPELTSLALSCPALSWMGHGPGTLPLPRAGLWRGRR